MTHHDAGHYADKHSRKTVIDPALATAIQAKAKNGRISCVAAHAIAQGQVVSPAGVGRTIDLLELRIDKCQMGFFGYSPAKKIVKPSKSIAAALESTLRPLVVDNKISCLDCWKIANQLDISRLDVASACEGLKIKVSPCQLGAF
jgi:hypothetical protein